MLVKWAPGVDIQSEWEWVVEWYVIYVTDNWPKAGKLSWIDWLDGRLDAYCAVCEMLNVFNADRNYLLYLSYQIKTFAND